MQRPPGHRKGHFPSCSGLICISPMSLSPPGNETAESSPPRGGGGGTRSAPQVIVAGYSRLRPLFPLLGPPFPFKEHSFENSL